MKFNEQALIASRVFTTRDDAHEFVSQWRADKTVNVRQFKRSVRGGGVNLEATLVVVRRRPGK